MNPLIQKLLAPVSEAQPCGPDYSYDSKFDELETILKGKPEVEIGSVQRPAEPPDWIELREKSAKFLAESKHLRVAVMFAGSLLKTQGLAGFRDGLQWIKEALEQHWLAIYPLLDPEDNNDPTQRLNILGVLTAPRASVSGWLTVMDYLYAAEVCRPKGLPPITFEQVFEAKSQSADSGAAAKLAAAIRGVDSKVIAGQQQVLAETLETARQIDQFLTTTLGIGGTISFEVLDKTLQEMVAVLNSYLPGTVPDAPADQSAPTDDAPPTEAGGGNPVAAIAIRGSVRSREDVVRVLDSLCDYYRQVEPSSPVPYLLRRAQKLATMDFVQTVQELNIATLESLRPSMGSTVEAASTVAAA